MLGPAEGNLARERSRLVPPKGGGGRVEVLGARVCLCSCRVQRNSCYGVRVSDGSTSALFVIDYVRRNDDEVRELQGGI